MNKDISFKFDGKVVLITAAGTSIGSRTATLFAKAGARVVLTDINEQAVAEVAKRCTDLSPDRRYPAIVIPADVRTELDCWTLIESTVRLCGQRLDVLVNNPDIEVGGGGSNAGDVNSENFLENYSHIMQMNLNSFVYLTHFAANYLQQFGGNIVNNNCLVPIVSSPLNSPHCMVNSSLNVFTKFMAAELRPKGVRINSVNPGGTRNNVHHYASPDALANTYTHWRSTLSKTPLPIDEIARAILYLASSEAGRVSGFNFVANCCCCKCFTEEIRAYFSLKRQGA